MNHLAASVDAEVLVRDLWIGSATRSVQDFAERVNDAVRFVARSAAQLALVGTCSKVKMLDDEVFEVLLNYPS